MKGEGLGIQNLSLDIQTIKKCFGRLSMTIVTLWDEDLRFSLVCILLALVLVLGMLVGAKVTGNNYKLKSELSVLDSASRAE